MSFVDLNSVLRVKPDPVTLPVEHFPALSTLPGILHAFTGKAAGLDVKVDRALALGRLDLHHTAARGAIGIGAKKFVIAGQVHGRDIVTVDARTRSPVPDADGLLTADPSVCLGIYVADCCAIYLADPVRRVIALLHSGRKGTDSAIATAAIEKMRDEFHCQPADIVAQLSPCIRPPNYETDFAADIVAQCRAAGLRHVHDCGTCTAGHVSRYYSYRVEKGKTGRMLALLALR